MKVFRVSHGDSVRLREGFEMRGKVEVDKLEVRMATPRWS